MLCDTIEPRTQIRHPLRHPILLLFPPRHLLSPISHLLLCSGTSNLSYRRETSLDRPTLSFRPENRKLSEIVRYEAVQEALLDQIRDDRLDLLKRQGQVPAP
jgi:hypothetical protein